MSGRRLKKIVVISVIVIGLYAISGTMLKNMGNFLIYDDPPGKSDAALVLNTGLEYYPRLIEAASIYKKALAEKVIINGNRKTDSLRSLETMGFETCCPWYEDRVRILNLLGVPERDVIIVSVEDAYDTITEAEAVGNVAVQRGCKKIVLITSKFHTRRAAHIWKHLFHDKLDVNSVSAKTDPFDPASWWKHGRQIRWVLAEYGAWIFYGWKSLTGV